VNLKRALAVLSAAGIALAAPAAAHAHASLLKAIPNASVVVNQAPADVSLAFSEAVEPRFAIVSVTNADGRQVTVGPPHRSQADPKVLVTPLKKIPPGWYLVYWRVISVDGHPVRGAFTFAVGPNPGPQPQFVIPSISETAATPRLLVARWLTFLTFMSAIGLFALRLFIGRSLTRILPGSSLRAVSIAFGIALGAALIVTPIYIVLATAEFALRSAWLVGALIPLIRASAFGRGYVDLELVLALFAVAAGITLWLDRPERTHRSIAELLAATGAVLAAVAALVVPGASGHAAQTSPRGVAMALDALHLLAGSIWLGGLIGLLVLWRSTPAPRRVRVLSYVVPRFSRVAFVSVMLLIASGTWAAVLHLPTLASLWQTSYGKALLAKVILLTGALLLAPINLLRTTPRLAAAERRPDLATGAAALLRRLVSGEVVFIVAALFCAALLSSLPPPSKALALIKSGSVRVGPGPVVKTVSKDGYKIAFRVSPNRAAVPNAFSVEVTRNGQPVHADVIARFVMLDMEMGSQEYRLREVRPGVFERSAPALVMVGHWAIDFEITPAGARQPITVLLVDRASG
jgi:copper transport protein